MLLRWSVTRCRRGKQSWKRWLLPAVLALARVLEEAYQTASSPLVQFPLLVERRSVELKMLLVRVFG